MAADLIAIRNGELMVTSLDGETEAGINFVDGLISAPMHVVDAGRVVLPEDDARLFVELARERGLSVEEVTQ